MSRFKKVKAVSSKELEEMKQIDGVLNKKDKFMNTEEFLNKNKINIEVSTFKIGTPLYFLYKNRICKGVVFKQSITIANEVDEPSFLGNEIVLKTADTRFLTFEVQNFNIDFFKSKDDLIKTLLNNSEDE